MRDYDPTTGRYMQADPLGLIPGPSLYGYARQSPMMYIDPDGENPFLAAMLIGGLASIALDYLAEAGAAYYQGRKICYSWLDGAKAFGMGAAASGGGLWATGLKRAGKEFSHAIPSRWLKNSRFGRWLDKRSNPYRSLNGNYVSKEFHAWTDFHRRIKDVPANRMAPAPLRYPLRAPLRTSGSLAGTFIPNSCACE